MDLAHDESHTFDAFISYRRAKGGATARWLRNRLEQYRFSDEVSSALKDHLPDGIAVPPKVFLDTAYERAGDDFLNDKIAPSLARARYLIVVSTPDAFEARSDGQPNWLVREIELFLKTKSYNEVIVVLGPEALEDQFPGALASNTQWDWVDLRQFGRVKRLIPAEWRKLDDAVTKIVAELYQIPSELLPELYEEDRRRRTSRLIRTTTLAVGVVIIAMVAGWQWNSANEKRRLAEAREDAAQATALRVRQPHALPTATLLVVQSANAVPTLLSQQELVQSLSLLPTLKASYASQASFPAAAFDPESQRLVVGSSVFPQGDIIEAWELGTPEPVFTKHIPAPRSRDIKTAVAPGGHHIAFSSHESVGQTSQLWLFAWNRWSDPIPIEGTAPMIFRGQVQELHFGPSGQELVVVEEKGVSVYEVATGTKVVYHPVPDEVEQVRIVGDLLAIGAGGRVYVLEDGLSASPRRLLDYDSEQASTQLLALDPQGQWVAAAFGSFPETLTLLRPGSDQAPLTLTLNRFLNVLRFLPDGQRLAVGDAEGMVELFDVPTLLASNVRVQHRGRMGFIDDIHVDEKGTWMATVSADKTGRVWDSETGEEVTRFSHGDNAVDHLFFIDHKSVLTIGSDRGIKHWSFANERLPFSNESKHFRFFASDSDGSCLAAASDAYGFHEMLIVACGPEGEAKWRLDVQEKIRGVRVDRRDGALVVQLDDRLLRWSQWRAQAARPSPDTIPIHVDPDTQSFLSGDGSRLVARDVDDKIIWMDTQTGTRLPLADAIETSLPPDLAISPDGSLLAVSYYPTRQTSVVRLPSVDTLFVIPRSYRQSIAFETSGRYMAVATASKPQRSSSDPTPVLQLWDLQTATLLDSLAIGTASMHGLDFSPEGTMVAVGSETSVVLLSIPDLDEVGRISVGSEVGQVMFLPDGRLVIGAEDVQIRQTSIDRLKREACRRLGAPDPHLLHSHLPEAAFIPQAEDLDPVAVCRSVSEDW